MSISYDVTATLREQMKHHEPIVLIRGGRCACGFIPGGSGKTRSIGYGVEVLPTMNAGENYAVLVYDARGNGGGAISPTITGDHQNRVTDYTALCVGNGKMNQMSMAEQANSLDTMHDQQAVLCGNPWDPQSERVFHGDGAWHSLAGNSGGGQSRDAIHTNAIVRRLTPLECERLQGYPDGWTDIGEWTDTKGKKHQTADSARYKALGNSIALPFWKVLARRISAQYDRDITMGSLFDGIGGFPLAFEHCGGKAVWASEIEEFPIAVTKVRFKE